MRDISAEAREIDEAVAGWTLPKVFAELVERFPDAPQLRWRDAGGDWQQLTLQAWRDQVRDATLGLLDLGARRGEFGLAMCSNRPEHVTADLATIHAGLVSATLYNTLAPEQIAWIVNHCEATVAIVETEEHLEKFREVKAQCPSLRTVVTIDAAAIEPWTVSWADLLRRGADVAAADPEAFDRAWQALQPDDLMSLIYTSGTTGTPKGVMYTHRNITWTAESMHRLWGDILAETSYLSYLPLAHVSERFTSHWGPLWHGLRHGQPSQVTFCPDLNQLLPYLLETRPSIFVAVPRIWEKFQTAVRAGIAAEPDPDRRALVQAALEAGRRAAELRQAGEQVPAELAAAVEQSAPVYRGILAKLGLDRAELAVTTTAPTPLELELFWTGLGLPLIEVWGMSELTGPATSVPLEQRRLGTIGVNIPGVEVRLAGDGELLARGGNVMAGYYRDDDKTAETIDADGWLHTGDVAAQDDDGWYRIVDRKKELIITSSGKNIAPAQVESLLKAHPLVGQAMTVGDNRNYLTALIVLDADAARAWAQRQGVAATDLAELSRDPGLVEEVRAAVADANRRLARIEQVKRFVLLPAEWTPESGELTPTQKMKRRVVHERYADEIAGMYADPPAGIDVAPVPAAAVSLTDAAVSAGA